MDDEALARGNQAPRQGEDDAGVILTLAGSLVSAGQGLIIHDPIRKGLVDAIVATGANLVDQDFFEDLGHRQYQGDPKADAEALRPHWHDHPNNTNTLPLKNY
ncbi:deoxyhypusine synthase family protein, partial [Thermus scotoductus]|uniref:deoxyhypusine synthase family protein n=1 Tax=Thermus scotoductus TaxID=37636 RepID=UPI0020A2D522